ncbi:MAG TPA: flagellar basal-body rod protein FlgF [Bacteroidota bacterium]|nr:flagellar basal-body rod protein FlgF [Bacteroidota bacterium]
MIKGIYTSGAGLRPKVLGMEVLANNLANINTAGYKRDDVFAQILRQSGQEASLDEGDLSGIQAEKYTSFKPGALLQTSAPLDLALTGTGFFAVETPQGTRYTRNGHFTLASDGTVTTVDGYPVQGTNGPIRIQEVDSLAPSGIVVTQTGEVLQENKPVGQIRVVGFDNLAGLKKEPNSLFSTAEKETQLDLTSAPTSIRQGYIEESNVDAISEMVSMIELSRSFESNQHALKAQDASLEKSLDVGKL